MVTQPAARDPVTHDLARTARTRVVGMALAMLVAPWFIVASNTGHAIMTLHGEIDDTTPQGALDMAAAHLTLDRWSKFAALIGALLLVPAVLGAMRVLRTSAARLSLIGGALMIAGYICYFAMVFQGATADAMVQVGGSAEQNIDVLQAVLDEPLTLWVYLLFVLGNFVGTFLVGLALLRSRTVSRWAGVGLLAWPVLHLFDVPFFESAGAAAQAVGFAITAAVLLRQDSAPELEGRSAPYELLRR